MVDVELLCLDTANNAVPNVYVAIHRGDTKARISYDYSDDSGRVVFAGVDDTLNDGGFELRIGSVYPISPLLGNVQAIQLDGEDAYFEARFNTHSITPPSDNRLCRLEGVVVEPSGNQSVRNTLSFRLMSGPSILSGTSPRLVNRSATSVITDDSGNVAVNLFRCCVYSVDYDGMDFPRLTFLVPDVATANLADVLRPRVTSIKYVRQDNHEELAPSNLPVLDIDVGDSVLLAVTPLSRYGLSLEDVLVSFASSDTDVARVVYQDGVLSVVGVSQGFCTIAASKEIDPDDHFPVTEHPSTTISSVIQVTVNG